MYADCVSTQIAYARGGAEFLLHPLDHVRTLRVGRVGAWPVQLPNDDGAPIVDRVVALRLPVPLAAKATRRVVRTSVKKGKKPDPRSVEAAQFVMVFSTLPDKLLPASGVMELYRYRWQIELAFKRMKKLLKLGRLPHQDPVLARTWILAKLVVALLLETLFRNARIFSPWGYSIESRVGEHAR